MSWRDLAGIASELAGDARRAVDRALGKTGAYHAIGYRGYATAQRALLLGRVLEHTRIASAEASQSRWRNLLAMVQRIDADPLPFAKVRARLGRHEADLVADDEGFVRQWVSTGGALSASGWHAVQLDVVAGPETPVSAQAHTPAHVLVPSAGARLGVISDMDDTVLQSEITSFVRAARLMLLENARTRLPFPGVAAFYRALERGAGSDANPIFYVSSSPWNLHDVITDFLDAQEIPVGPMLLRDWDIGREMMRTRQYKLSQIREIMGTYPSLPFILVGDSGQEDPEIYGELVTEFPGRILAIYIRNVSPHPERLASIRALADRVSAAGSTLLLADDTLTAARHAAAHGWIEESALPEIGTEKRADEGTSGAK
ncbi:MAG TPA: phosphatase domain-containing protein, partial [Casimicrobiaceae bacterium]|nr:phosphatase domain-containing protein [Casimicrobiaceae bacterium]